MVQLNSVGVPKKFGYSVGTPRLYSVHITQYCWCACAVQLHRRCAYAIHVDASKLYLYKLFPFHVVKFQFDRLKGHLPSRQFINMYRLISVSTPVCFHQTVPLILWKFSLRAERTGRRGCSCLTLFYCFNTLWTHVRKFLLKPEHKCYLGIPIHNQAIIK